MTTIANTARRGERIESLVVAAAVGIVAAITLGYAFLLGTVESGPPRLLDWQVSAFFDLGPDDQAIHSALSAAAEEIGAMNYDFGDWAKPDELDRLLMPPFYKDEFFARHGSVDWRQLGAADYTQGGDTAYFGSGGLAPDQSAYLLIFRHRHIGSAYSNQTEIWVNPNAKIAAPEAYRAEFLARAGWRQVIPYSGADEVARLKGN